MASVEIRLYNTTVSLFPKIDKVKARIAEICECNVDQVEILLAETKFKEVGVKTKFAAEPFADVLIDNDSGEKFIEKTELYECLKEGIPIRSTAGLNKNQVIPLERINFIAADRCF